jgi:hypothetical protein
MKNQNAFGHAAEPVAHTAPTYAEATLSEAAYKAAKAQILDRAFIKRPPATRTKADALEILHRANLAIRGARNVG